MKQEVKLVKKLADKEALWQFIRNVGCVKPLIVITNGIASIAMREKWKQMTAQKRLFVECSGTKNFSANSPFLLEYYFQVLYIFLSEIYTIKDRS